MKSKVFVSVIFCLLFFSAVLLSQPITLEVWGYFSPGTHGIYETIDLWNQSHQDVKLKYTYIPFENLKAQYTRAIISGNVPDIAYIDNPDHASFAAMGALEDITSRVMSEELKEKTNQFFEGPFNSVIYNEKVFGLPDNSNTICLFYNKDMFREVGLDPNSPPQTWNELSNYASKLSDPKSGTYGLIFSAMKSEEGTFQILPWIQMAGADFTTLDSPQAIKALKYLSNFIHNGWTPSDVMNLTQTEAFGFFTSERSAMAICGPWVLFMLEDVNFDWGVTLLPVNEETGIRSSALGGENVAIMAGSKHKEEAWEVLKWLYYDDENYVRHTKAGARLPSREGLENLNPEWQQFPLSVFMEQMKYAQARGPHPQWPQISNYIQIAFQKVFSGQATPEKALAEAADNINKLL